MKHGKKLVGVLAMALISVLMIVACNTPTGGGDGSPASGNGDTKGFTITGMQVYTHWTSSSNNTKFTGITTVKVMAYTDGNQNPASGVFTVVPGASMTIKNGKLTLVLPDTVPDECLMTETSNRAEITFSPETGTLALYSNSGRNVDHFTYRTQDDGNYKKGWNLYSGGTYYHGEAAIKERLSSGNVGWIIDPDKRI